MKRVIKNLQSLIGKQVTIHSPESWADGEWGTVIDVDDDGYVYVAIANDNNCALQFDRSEIRIRK